MAPTIHVVWVGDESRRPDNCIDTWKFFHNVRVWGNDDLRDGNWINVDHIQQMMKKELNGVGDLMRYEILYRHGGLAVDADSICLKQLPDWLFEPNAFASWENELDRPGLIAMAALYSKPKNPFIYSLIQSIKAKKTVVDKPAWRTVGPQAFTDHWREKRYSDLTIYPSHYFIPTHYTGTKYQGTGPVFAHQIWDSTVKNDVDLHLRDTGGMMR
jgi:mannosyltransferase OCH1-like enzyme